MAIRTKAEKLAQEEARESLRKLLPPGSRVYTILKNVSASGMSRRISCVIKSDEGIQNIDWLVARALDYRRNDRDGAIVVGGCGMDMGFHIVTSLSYALHGYSLPCATEEQLAPFARSWRGPGADAGTDDRDGPLAPNVYRAGYTLSHEWL